MTFLSRTSPLPLAVVATCLWITGGAQAQVTSTLADPLPVSLATNPQTQREDRWVLGLNTYNTPTTSGSGRNTWGIKPVLAGRVGRWMVSTSSARSLAGLDVSGGVSTNVVQGARWTMGLGARITQGRDSGDDMLLTGLPHIERSLALRASARYQIDPRWRLTGSLQQDLLHSQGLRAQVGLGWTRPLDGWVLDLSAGLTLADRSAMHTFFGVDAPYSSPTRAAWQPQAGLEQWGWGASLSRALSPHWRVSAGIGQSTLLGDAARSPLVMQRSGHMLQVGVAYVGW